MPYPQVKEPKQMMIDADAVLPPHFEEERVELDKGSNVKPLPIFGALPAS